MAITELTERRAAAQALRDSEERFLQAQMMEAIGVLARSRLQQSVDRDNRILAARRPSHGQGGAAERGAGVDKGCADRARAITAKLLTFSRWQVVAPRLVDLNNILLNLEEMLRHPIGEHINLKTNLDTAAGTISADPGQIE